MKVLSNGISPLRKWLRRKVIVSFKSSDAVALTFDDGPDPLYTPQVLEVLKRHGAKATFFVLGRQAEMYPHVIQQIVKSGCEVANHSYSHPSFSLISLSERVDEIRKCQSAIGTLGKMFFRPPFGHANFGTPFWASLLGYATVCWSVDARDWEIDDPNAMFELLSTNVTPGSVILLHDRIETATDAKFFAREAMLEALERLLDSSALKFKTLSEMFASSATVESEWDRHFPKKPNGGSRTGILEPGKECAMKFLLRARCAYIPAFECNSSISTDWQGSAVAPIFQSMIAPGSRDTGGSAFVFGIPLIGSYLTDNFQGICKLLGETLDSCLQQTDGDFIICVACNEIPDARLVPSSTKIQYILTKALNRSEIEASPRADVSLKRYTLMNAAVDLRARYYFQFDADDLVSAKLVGFVRKSSNRNGCILNSGYLLDSRTQLLYLFPNPQFPGLSFYELCGSSNVVSLDPTPNDYTKRSNTNYLERILWPGHHVAKKSYENEGRPAQDLNFPACIYRANHGSNLYLKLNRSDRTNFMDSVASSCTPLAGDILESVRKEFGFLG